VLNVLVADDDFANLEALSTALMAAGHRVLRAGDGGDALRILTNQPCDVVVCDDEMPVLTGPQLVGAMQANTRLAGIPTILMIDMYASRHVPVNAAAVIAKPVMLPQLLALIDQVRRTS
jgi:two-component system phosphate regulon response regulator PhoB